MATMLRAPSATDSSLDMGFLSSLSRITVLPFGDTLLSTIYAALDIDARLTPLHYPASNGLVEHFMQPLRTMIVFYVGECQDDWDRYLRQFRFAYNTSFHPSIQETPFFLVHSRDARTPIDTISPNFISTYEQGKGYKADPDQKDPHRSRRCECLAQRRNRLSLFQAFYRTIPYRYRRSPL
jgi:hypothetical protein